MKNLFVLFVLIVSIHNSQAQEEEITKVLEAQVECWNKGDLECFMQSYLNSDELVFVGSNGPRYGWQVTLNNYKKSYPDRAAMGTLSFDLLKFQPVGKKHYLVIGKWVLNRERDAPQGHFSLVLEKIKGEWKIIADHSS
ncbi:MAG: nuclear transport factor 2 family protein [Cytophagales bacterium]|nr:nuclear transport factor 2 family protein [Cytophagales bacterium]